MRPIPSACDIAPGVSACERGSVAPAVPSWAGAAASASHPRPSPMRLPPSPSIITCSRYTETTCHVPAPTHFSTAMLFSFWSMNTRVTLETPMPPRTTTTSPTRLR
jgi:hypothetical protein